ncbi:MAG TPA: tetratricopeptide repeat protein [Anaerolineaceae bacterium]|nr:tetratricopeptide repeat protein [Anaerolineaceae bacterium]
MPKQPEALRLVDVEPEQINPSAAADFVQRGWLFYERMDYPRAEADFHQAIAMQPGDLDAQYALALTLKHMGKSQEAIPIFETVNRMAEQLTDQVRGRMIRRLSTGHINQITQGDWNLAPDVWKRTS